MRTRSRFVTFSITMVFLGASLAAHGVPLLTNGDFSSGLTGWTTVNSGDGFDTAVVWIVNDPTGTNPQSNNGASGGPASRVLYQDFTVPAAGVASASFSFDYFATNGIALNSDTFTTFNNVPGGGSNGTRVDILDPASDVIAGPVLFNLFAPTDGAPVGTATAPVPNTFANTAALASFLNSNAGNTLRLRLGNREEDFPWDTGFDNLDLDVTGAAPAQPIPTLSEWGRFILLLSLVLLAAWRLGLNRGRTDPS